MSFFSFNKYLRISFFVFIILCLNSCVRYYCTCTSIDHGVQISKNTYPVQMTGSKKIAKNQCDSGNLVYPEHNTSCVLSKK